jgi:hypothetical protein
MIKLAKLKDITGTIYIDGKTIKEISEVTGLSWSCIYSRHRRGVNGEENSINS